MLRVQGGLGLALGATVLVCLALLAWYAWATIGTVNRAESANAAAADVRALAALIGPLPADTDTAARADVATSIARYGHATDSRVSVFDSAGCMVADSLSGADADCGDSAPEVVAALTTGGASRAARLDSGLGGESVFFAHALPNGTGVVRVAVPDERLTGGAGSYRDLVVWTAVLAAALAFLLTLLIVWRTAAPVRILARSVRAGGALSGDVFTSGSGDVREIARGFTRVMEEARETTRSAVSEHSRLVAILENLSAGILVVDADEQVLLTNPVSADLLGFDRATAEDRTLIELVRDYEAVEIVRSALRTHAPASGEVSHGADPGRSTRLVAVPYREGAAERVVLAVYDISEERRAQRLRHEFLANASHEIRTPLAAIQATLETLELGAVDDPAAARPFVASALGEVERLSALVGGLLELSRLEMGWARLSLQTLAVEDVVRRAVDALSALASRAGLDVRVNVPPGVTAITADPERLHQALVNLLHNAIKFTPAGGRITCAARDDEELVWIAIEDTGIGIPAADVPVLMDRILQGSTTGPRGAGLGLAIVKQIIEAHGGRVHVQSNEGHGSTFSIALPKAP